MKTITKQVSFTNRDELLNSYFKDLRKTTPLTHEEEINLSARIKNGDQEALNKLVVSNLRFVVTVAKQYQHQGLDLTDLIQCGNEGLIKAARLYDGTKGCKFISYAVWWIRQSIVGAIYKVSNTIKFSISHVIKQHKIKKIVSKLEAKLGRAPTIEEIADNIELSESQINDIFLYDKDVVSTDDSTGLEDITVGDTIYGNDYPDEEIDKDSITEEIGTIISRLGDREQDIIRMFFGISVKELTLEEIGEKFGTTAERIRQIKEDALIKLKNRYSEELKNLL